MKWNINILTYYIHMYKRTHASYTQTYHIHTLRILVENADAKVQKFTGADTRAVAERHTHIGMQTTAHR